MRLSAVALDSRSPIRETARSCVMGIFPIRPAQRPTNPDPVAIARHHGEASLGMPPFPHAFYFKTIMMRLDYEKKIPQGSVTFKSGMEEGEHQYARGTGTGRLGAKLPERCHP